MSDLQGSPPYPEPPPHATRKFLLLLGAVMIVGCIVVAVAAGVLPWQTLLVLGALYAGALLWVRKHYP